MSGLMKSFTMMAVMVLLLSATRPTRGASIVDRINEYLGRSSSLSVHQAESNHDSYDDVDTTLMPDVTAADAPFDIASEGSVSKSRSRRWTSISIATLESTTSNLQSRSVCPWTNSYNYDPNRHPQYLIQAQCNFTTVPGTTRQCEHVYTFVPVKRTDTATGTVSDQWLKLKVGCTLASPPVVNQPPITTN